jgi:hypothetical protein
MFEQIKLKTNNNRLKHLIVDFEEAPVTAFEQNFKNVSVNYCLFHFGQIFYRNILTSGLSNFYNSNETFKLDIKMLLSLSFVEISEVQKYFDELKRYLIEKYDIFELNEHGIKSGLNS